MGSATRNTLRAPARWALSNTACFSTLVMPEGMAMTTRGPNMRVLLPLTFLMK